jgi:aminoglycoside phosphotransferase (APT) family kinase protein
MATISIVEIEKNLLKYFQETLSNRDISYKQPPVLFRSGRDLRTYRFALSGAPEEYSKGLILRLYPDKDVPVRPHLEKILLNTLHEQGLPVPKAFFAESDNDVFFTPFLVMEECQGEVLFDINSLSQKPYMQAARFLLSGIGSIARQLATVAIDLHAVPSDKLVERLKPLNFPIEHLSLNGRLYQLYKRVQNAKLTGLEEGVVWLISHGPPEPENPVICHGQLYPNNIRKQDDRITGILSWSMDSILVGDPAYELGRTSAAFKCFVPHVSQSLIGLTFGVGKRFSKQFILNYVQQNPIEKKHIEYFEMMWCIDLAASAAESIIGQTHIYKKEFEEARIDLYKSAANAVEMFTNTTGVSVTLPLLRR